jgi:hypothetical protein
MVFKKVVSFIVFVCFSMLLVSQPISPSIAQMEDNQEVPALTLDQAQATITQQRGFFTENKGQWDEEILFVGDTDFGKVAFTKDAIYYQEIQVEEQTNDPIDPEPPENEFMADPFYDRLDPIHREPPVYSSNIIELSFVDAENPEIEGLKLLPHYYNYFIGNDSSKWGIECRNFAQVTYTNIWEGIDLTYFFSPEGLKYEYYVHPHAQIEDLRIQVHGAGLSHNNDTLRMDTFLGTLKDDHLVVFGQDSNNTITAKFSVEADTFSFTGIPSDRTETIVIDPLVYGAFLGGSDNDYAYSITVDTQGCAYISGETCSFDFPMDVTVGGLPAPGYNQSFSGDYDAFVVKLNASGTELLYSTYLGGSKYEHVSSLAIDTAGNAYIAGYTLSSDFPMDVSVGGLSVSGYDQSFHGERDAFVVKLNASGEELLYSTYLGENSTDKANSIAVDSMGNAYIAGTTRGSDFPMDVTVGGLPAPGYNQSFSGDGDAFVVKLNASGSELLYATFLGGHSTDSATSLAIDTAGNAYISGETCSSDFPMDVTVGGPTAPGYDQSFNGERDAFVVKLNASGEELLYSTYLGGSNYDYAYSIAIDFDGNAYISGLTRSSDFPMNNSIGGSPTPGYNQSFNGGSGAFVVNLNASGTELLYATYLGGSGTDGARSIAIDTAGNAYITGQTSSLNFPMDVTVGGPTAPGYNQSFSGDGDAFVVKLNASGTELLYSTYLGGSNYDCARSIAIDTAGNAYIAGYTLSSDFPMNNSIGGSPAPGYDQSFNGERDAFVVKLDFNKPVLGISASADASSYTEGTQPVLTVSLANTGVGYANSCEVLVTLPQELIFLDDQLIVSTPGPGNSQLFQAGGIPAGGSIAFPVFVEVIGNVPADTTVLLHFDATCLENATDNTTLPMTLLHTPPPVPCPELFIRVDSDKTSYMFEEFIRFTITLDNDGGPATNTRLEIDLPPEVTYQSVDTYPVLVNGQHLLISIGTIDELGSTEFQLHLKVTTPVQNQTIAPMYMNLFADECGAHMSKTVNIYLTPKPRCPNLTVETTPNKPNYYYGDLVYLNVTLRNLGGQATDVKLELDLPPALSYAGCDTYRAVGQDQHQAFTIGTMEPDSVLRFVIYAHVNTDVKVAKSIPILLELTANECDSFARRLINIKLEPKRTGQQNLDLSVKLLNLEFDEDTGKYYLPYDQTLELQLQVSGYETYYNYTIHWGDGETTTLKNEISATILLKHKFTDKGSMHIKITIHGTNGREKTSTMYVTVK